MSSTSQRLRPALEFSLLLSLTLTWEIANSFLTPGTVPRCLVYGKCVGCSYVLTLATSSQSYVYGG